MSLEALKMVKTQSGKPRVNCEKEREAGVGEGRLLVGDVIRGGMRC